MDLNLLNQAFSMPILIRSKLVKSGGIGIAHFQISLLCERLWDSFASPGPAGVGAMSLAETVTSRPSGDRTTA